MEYLERLRFQPLVENRDLHPAALGQKKGGQSERLPNSKRAAKGSRMTQVDKIFQGHSDHQVGNFHDLQELQLPGWLHSSKNPQLRDKQPTALFSRPAPPGSQTDKPYPGIRPTRGKPCLQQLQMQSIEAYTCVFGPVFGQWRQAQQPGSRKHLFPPCRHQ